MAECDTSWPKQSDSNKENVRNSYNLQTLSRVQTVLRAVKQTEALGRKLQKEIENSLFQVEKKQSKFSELEKLILQKTKVQEECEWRRRKLQREKEHFDAVQTGNLQKDRHLKQKFDSLKKDRSRLHEKKKIYFSVREELIKSGAQLVMRRKQLISELAFIYPIREVSSNTFTIAGKELPNAEQFQGYSDVLIEVAMGHTCHLVLMISHFLDMPLRYMMKHCGSKSVVYDYILDKLSDKEREFVLSSRGHEKFQFDYGVYLLNKNIAQLRYYCGLGTTDLRLTLPNLRTLLQLRLGVNFDHLDSSKSERLVRSMYSPPKQKGSSTHSTHSDPVPSHPYIANSVDSGEKVKLKEAKASVSDSMSQQSNHEADDVFKPSFDSFFNSANNIHNNQSDIETKRDHNKSEIQDQFPAKWNYKQQSAKFTGHSSSLLDQLAKEKLLGPIANDEEIDVSSSEDSASAVYRSKLCPKLEENLIPSVRSGKCDESASTVSEDKALNFDCRAAALGSINSGEMSSSDNECSDVEGVATFRHKAYKTVSEDSEYTEASAKKSTGDYVQKQVSETEVEVKAWESGLDIHSDDTPTFQMSHQ